MKDNFMSLLFSLRSFLMLKLYPNSKHALAIRKLQPLSTKFGFDRGTPIDRYWIESFLKQHANFIKGNCMEIGDDRYTKQFGTDKVTHIEIVDINEQNKKATIYGDLRSIPQIKDNTFDTIVLTHVLGMIDDLDSAVKEIYRILKPGGTVLVTVACLAPIFEGNAGNWRIMPGGAKYLFEKHFTSELVKIKTYGNVYSGQCFWVGMSQEELSTEELEFNDPNFPCITTIVATK
jgi:SAM-dependent methyltransferase